MWNKKTQVFFVEWRIYFNFVKDCSNVKLKNEKIYICADTFLLHIF